MENDSNRENLVGENKKSSKHVMERVGTVNGKSSLSRQQLTKTWKEKKQRLEAKKEIKKPLGSKKESNEIPSKKKASHLVTKQQQIRNENIVIANQAFLQIEQANVQKTVAQNPHSIAKESRGTSGPTALRTPRSSISAYQVMQSPLSTPRNSITPKVNETQNSSTPTPAQIDRAEQLRLWKIEKAKKKMEEDAKRQKQGKKPSISHPPRRVPEIKEDIVDKVVLEETVRQTMNQIKKTCEPTEVRQKFEAMLRNTEDFPNIGKMAIYWIERAKFEEEMGEVESLLFMFEQASSHCAQVIERFRSYTTQPIREVSDALDSYINRLRMTVLNRFSRIRDESNQEQIRQAEDMMEDFITNNDLTPESTNEQLKFIKDMVSTLDKIPTCEKTPSSPLTVKQREDVLTEVLHQTLEAMTEAANSEENVDQENAQEGAQEEEIEFFDAIEVLGGSDEFIEEDEAVDPTKIPLPDSPPVFPIQTYAEVEQIPQTEKPVEEAVFKKPIATPSRKIKAGRVSFVPDNSAMALDDDAEEEKESSSMFVLTPIQASSAQKKMMGSGKILTEVRRSVRRSTPTHIGSLDNSNISSLLQQTGYAFSPNHSIRTPGNTPQKVLFQQKQSTPYNRKQVPEEEEQEGLLKYLSVPEISKFATLDFSTPTKEGLEEEYVDIVEDEDLVDASLINEREELEKDIFENISEQVQSPEVTGPCEPEEACLPIAEEHEEHSVKKSSRSALKSTGKRLGRFDTLMPLPSVISWT